MAEEERRTWFPAGVLPAEVVFFLFKIGEALLEPSVRLYITEGVCRQTLEFHNKSTTKCSRLSDYPDEEDSVQSTAANYLMYYKLIINLPALLLLLFCGAWSDRVGRKLPVILSSFGTVIAVIFFMISRVTVKWTAFLCLVFAGAAVRGVFGKSTVMTMAMHRSPLILVCLSMLLSLSLSMSLSLSLACIFFTSEDALVTTIEMGIGQTETLRVFF